MYVDETVLTPLRVRYGLPRALEWEGEISEREYRVMMGSGRGGRRHDVTLFIFNGERLALIRKAHFAEGVWRTPGGGIKRGEDFEAGAVREALEEVGAEVELAQYLVHAAARFDYDGETTLWNTHVFAAHTETEELAPQDTEEIAAARWGTAAELQGPIREAALATGRAFWRYRVALHDASLEALR
jgi:ADP-ribose pyrophosphatase YjhB (NUDIX family)